MIRTLRLLMLLLVVSCDVVSPDARSEVLVAELAGHVDRTVQASHGDRRPGDTVEPRRLDHRVAGGIGEAHLVAHARRGDQAVLAEDVTGQAAAPGDDRAVVAGGRDSQPR